MRIVETWSTQQFKTTIYAMERWHYVEFEAGPMKQGFKFMKESHPSTAEVKEALNQPFLDEVYRTFEKMFLIKKMVFMDQCQLLGQQFQSLQVQLYQSN